MVSSRCYCGAVLLAIIQSIDATWPPRLVAVPVAAANRNSWSHNASNITILDHINGHHCGYLVSISTNHFFTVQRPINNLAVVSQQAKQHACQIAVNGGPFQKNGDSVGGVVVDGEVISDDFQDTNVGFGILFNKTWILGGIRNATESRKLHVQHYVTGFGWLVYDGEIVARLADNRHLRRRHHERAPRTAIGVTQSGRLLVLVVDGCEACLRHEGVTLHELATLFQAHGVRYAINLDGGSSTTLVQDSQVVNVPTCMDVPWKCERPVATIVCIQQQYESDETESEEEEDAQ